MGLPLSVRQVQHPSKAVPVESHRTQTPVENRRMQHPSRATEWQQKDKISYDNSLSKSRSIGGSTLQT